METIQDVKMKVYKFGNKTADGNTKMKNNRKSYDSWNGDGKAHFLYKRTKGTMIDCEPRNLH